MKRSIILSFLAVGSMCMAQQIPQSSQPTQSNQATQSSQPGQAQAPPAQTPNGTGQNARRMGPQHYRMLGGPMVARLTRELNLTPDQQTQARNIFAQARQEVKTLDPQLRSERQQVRAAIRSNDPARIDQIALRDANVNARALAIHEKAIAKVYSTLTADQKAKFDQMGARWRENARIRRNDSNTAVESR
jgi:Spy/CpxP family protein refolding chaperone